MEPDRMRRNPIVRHFATYLLTAITLFASASLASAQRFNDPFGGSKPGGGIIGQFDSSAGLTAEPATLKASIVSATADHPAVLLLKVKIAVGKHAYSISQPPGGPLPTRIQLEPSKEYRVLGEFAAYPAPHSRIEKGPVWTGLEIQEHEGEVNWFVPIELTAGVSPEALAVQGTVHMEICQTGGYCEPVEKTFTAKLSANTQLPADMVAKLPTVKPATPAIAASDNTVWSSGSFQFESSAVKFTGNAAPSSVQAGEATTLEFTATLPKGSRIYARTDRDHRPGTKPVLIALDQTSGLLAHRATTDAPVQSDNSVPQFGVMRYHEGEVKWTLRVEVPKTAPAGDYPISGVIGYQSCEYKADGKNICELPQAIRFRTMLHVGDSKSATSTPIEFASGVTYPEAARIAAAFANSLDAQSPSPKATDPENIAPVVPFKDHGPALSSSNQYDLGQIRLNRKAHSMGYYIAIAFVGGMLLNLMPCVLPVIGLKVMSFVEQAGKNRAHALVLNLWFSLGITSVFLVLAILASLPQLGLASESLGWGGQFGSTAFNVIIASIVFAMALSLLGVWEVPIPGFFGSRSVHEATKQEGPLGAVLKGVVTTVLATPCTAPFMASAVAWAITQPFVTTLIVFASLGAGMAVPYIVIGVFPELLRFLPKPGPWMETFKQVSGFILLATVIFILSFIEQAALVPTILLLLGIAVACWFAARTPITAESRDRLISWCYSGVIVLVFLGVSFGWLYRVINAPADPGWQPFSLAKLKELSVDQQKTVLVDFSAEWCINCKVLEKTVLHTKPVEQAIERSNVVTMYADYTKYPEEIRRTIHALGANGVPVIAIFPGNAPYEPIVFGGGYSKDGLISAIQQATQQGRSSSAEVAEASIMPRN